MVSLRFWIGRIKCFSFVVVIVVRILSGFGVWCFSVSIVGRRNFCMRNFDLVEWRRVFVVKVVCCCINRILLRSWVCVVLFVFIVFRFVSVELLSNWMVVFGIFVVRIVKVSICCGIVRLFGVMFVSVRGSCWRLFIGVGRFVIFVISSVFYVFIVSRINLIWIFRVGLRVF